MRKIVRVPAEDFGGGGFAFEVARDGQTALYDVACTCEAWRDHTCITCPRLPETAETVAEHPEAEARYGMLPSALQALCYRSVVYRGPGLTPDPHPSPRGRGKLAKLSYRSEDGPGAVAAARAAFEAGEAVRLRVPLADVEEGDIVERAAVVPHRWAGEP